jgi:hypothetical protein
MSERALALSFLRSSDKQWLAGLSARHEEKRAGAGGDKDIVVGAKLTASDCRLAAVVLDLTGGDQSFSAPHGSHEVDVELSGHDILIALADRGDCSPQRCVEQRGNDSAMQNSVRSQMLVAHAQTPHGAAVLERDRFDLQVIQKWTERG